MNHPIHSDRGSVTGRVALERRVVQIHDVAADPDYTLTESITLSGQRTALGVPLMRQDDLTGVIILARRRVEPFTQRQIDLVSSFADQAVIAIANTALLRELRELLEQQTAMAEILQAINASPGDLQPVFALILRKAHALCGAAIGSLVLHEGGRFRSLAARGLNEEAIAVMRPPVSATPRQQALLDGARFIQDLDIRASAAKHDNPWNVALLRHTQARTGLWVPLRRDTTLLGFITVFREEVRAFSEREIQLLESFAAQAVVAMDNARLLVEQREALERQTATAEVLQIINASPGHLAPVLRRIAGSGTGALWRILRNLTNLGR